MIASRWGVIFIKNNLQETKEFLTPTIFEDGLHSRCNMQACAKKINVISDTALFRLGAKGGRGGGGGGSHDEKRSREKKTGQQRTRRRVFGRQLFVAG